MLEDAAAGYLGAVLVLVGAPVLSSVDKAEVDERPRRSRVVAGGVERTAKGLLTVPLPAGRSLAAAWGLESDEPGPPALVTDRVAEVVGR